MQKEPETPDSQVSDLGAKLDHTEWMCSDQYAKEEKDTRKATYQIHNYMVLLKGTIHIQISLWLSILATLHTIAPINIWVEI